MPTPTLALVGGFLGSGKTTLLLAAARLLRDRGMRVALITNDQGEDLVDTQLAKISGFDTEEVTGGCFCCRFTDLLCAAGRLLELQPDVILAEPTGSCMDLSATILRPLQTLYDGRFRVAPLTVLVDPGRAADLTDPHIAYLFRNQLAEADIVCFSQCDRFNYFPDLGVPVDFHLSARSGVGVAEWLDAALGGERVAGGRLIDPDYLVYAEAEAALGWLNWSASVSLRRALSPAMVAGPLLDELDRALTAAGTAIVHLKLLAQSPSGSIKAALCRNGDEPSVQGNLAASPAAHHDLVLNLRARAYPETLEKIVATAVSHIPGRLSNVRMAAFQPAPPKPEHRVQGSK